MDEKRGKKRSKLFTWDRPWESIQTCFTPFTLDGRGTSTQIKTGTGFKSENKNCPFSSVSTATIARAGSSVKTSREEKISTKEKKIHRDDSKHHGQSSKLRLKWRVRSPCQQVWAVSMPLIKEFWEMEKWNWKMCARSVGKFKSVEASPEVKISTKERKENSLWWQQTSRSEFKTPAWVASTLALSTSMGCFHAVSLIRNGKMKLKNELEKWKMVRKKLYPFTFSLTEIIKREGYKTGDDQRRHQS